MRNAGAGTFNIFCHSCRRETFATHVAIGGSHFNRCLDCGQHYETMPRVRHAFQRRRISYAANAAMRLADERRRVYEEAKQRAAAAHIRSDDR